MVGLDFSAAFNRVNHKALIFKLRQLGVGGPFLSILTEFLLDRQQRVVVDGQFNPFSASPKIGQVGYKSFFFFFLFIASSVFMLERCIKRPFFRQDFEVFFSYKHEKKRKFKPEMRYLDK